LKKNGEKNIDQSVKEKESTSAIVRAREETFNCIAKKLRSRVMQAGHANHTHGNGAEFAQDPLSLPSGPITSGAEFGQDPLSLPSGPITRLRAKRFKEALNGLIQENGADSKKIKMGSNNNQGLVHVIKAVGEVN
jgi:hypothetical protein